MSELLPSLGRICLLLAAAWGLAAIGAHFISAGMIFPRPPLKYAPGPDIVTLTAPDGTRLATRHWPNPGAKYTILYLHGNYEDLGSLADYVPQFLQAGYAVFAFDYRRYGLSEGTPDETNLYADTRLAYDHVRQHLGVPAERILVFGYSLGGAPAIDLALHRPVAGLVLQGAFVSAYRVMTRIPLFPGDKLVNLRKAAHVTCPVLVIHGTDDRTVPCWHGEALYAAVKAPKQSLFIGGGPHAGLADFAGPRYWEALQQFTAWLERPGLRR